MPSQALLACEVNASTGLDAISTTVKADVRKRVLGLPMAHSKERRMLDHLEICGIAIFERANAEIGGKRIIVGTAVPKLYAHHTTHI